jgi:hypothetical protein
MKTEHKLRASGFVRMKMHCFEFLSANTEHIHGPRLQRIFLVEASVNAEIDGPITWPNRQLDALGLLKRTISSIG